MAGGGHGALEAGRRARRCPFRTTAPGRRSTTASSLHAGDASRGHPPAGLATMRFRNDVPWWILIPHIIAMMGALLMSTRAALEATAGGPKLKEFTLRTLSALFVGGFPLGCAVSGYAFGQPWGGFPIGSDATDNKTLVAFAALGDRDRVRVPLALAARLGRRGGRRDDARLHDPAQLRAGALSARAGAERRRGAPEAAESADASRSEAGAWAPAPSSYRPAGKAGRTFTGNAP